MIFSSHIFVYYFLPFTLAVYYALYAWRPQRQRLRNLWLVLTGYTFYGWAGPRFVILMFVTTNLDWLMSLVIAHDDWRFWRFGEQGFFRKPVTLLPNTRKSGATRSRGQHAAITVSVVSNLLVLGFFKYFNLGVDSYNGIVAGLGFTAAQWHNTLNVILPLGISFYTFQALSYTIDVYRGDAEAMANFIDFSCFVSMFPHLVAGPILKFSFLADQLKNRTLTSDKFARGVAFFSLGLAKKILLANPCGKIADTCFDAGSLHTLDAWFGAFAYSFQIYFDFSGYSDMAIGLGLMLGFVFAKNFDSPYRSDSITTFWQRWHISLSTWLREYLYIPLGGNRRGDLLTYRNLIVTMLLGGLWHGASWNFMIWGGLHGGMLAFERRFFRQPDNTIRYPGALPRVVWVGVVFIVVLLGWVFFRATDLPHAGGYLASMFGAGHPQPGASLLAGLVYRPYYLLSVAIAAVVVWFAPQTWEWTQRLTLPKAATCLALGWLALVILATQEYNPFIYFIF